MRTRNLLMLLCVPIPSFMINLDANVVDQARNVFKSIDKHTLDFFEAYDCLAISANSKTSLRDR